jgi:hypothetical protein
MQMAVIGDPSSAASTAAAIAASSTLPAHSSVAPNVPAPACPLRAASQPDHASASAGDTARRVVALTAFSAAAISPSLMPLYCGCWISVARIVIDP